MITENFIEGAKVLYGEKQQIFKHINSRYNENKKTWIITLNTLMFMEYFKSSIYKKSVQKADLLIPDGIGIVKLMNKKGLETERCPGIDTMKYFCELSGKLDKGIFLLGTKDETLKKAKNNLEIKFSSKISGMQNGFFSKDQDQNIVDKINSSKSDFLFVGMGIPRQEDFILNNYEKINSKIIMGVGGSIDVFAGEVRRAPILYQKLGIEWLYRMLKEPKRFKKFPDLIKFYLKYYLKR
jgi:N-acetylglucosaminyldiphosphoundecaprenol N-acetyl-beta-D-mannosaminyltransferase